MKTEVEHVSDTALWVGAFRALESERRDALFKDPFAARLAGEKGMALTRSMPFTKIMAWSMALRTLGIDRLVRHAVDELGCETVLNLGAGLDSRPYRLDFSKKPSWIEADFERMIRHKSDCLSDAKPLVPLERRAMDLSVRENRRELFRSLAGKTLLITEGLLPYLTESDVSTLIEDVTATQAIAYWVFDYRNDVYSKRIKEKISRALKKSPFQFNPKDWLGFFGERGWTLKTQFLTSDLARENRRPLPFPWRAGLWLMNSERLEKVRQASGYALVELKKL